MFDFPGHLEMSTLDLPWVYYAFTTTDDTLKITRSSELMQTFVFENNYTMGKGHSEGQTDGQACNHKLQCKVTDYNTMCIPESNTSPFHH